ncbi:3-oxoacyl-[acyl-carrier-protein] synthase 3 [Croceicoccus mobilis]|uniref:Beta-ketoacyl-[acyl-carrier-protein] synthase III n=1 Tax=Croceicoccus mobilis TaxID=1703339 RepID=A0A916YZ19_9SPHN|nr:3-oxoacyl-[acyl-carrier-protein] synthase 3 [Croceicoccus mobilis]
MTGAATIRRSCLIGTGSALPARRVSNAELAETIDTSDEWIQERTGIGARHLAGEGETTATLAADAAKKAIEAAGITAADISVIVLATATPDQTFPSSASKVQDLIGAKNAFAFDVAAVCSGFLYAMATADALLKTPAGAPANGRQCALVIGSETFSRILDWEDRGTCVLFGDGAGAVILEARDFPAGEMAAAPGVIASRLHTDGAHNELLYVDGGPSTTGTVGKLRMKGREVFRHAVTNLADVLREVMEEAGIAADQLDWVVPHQANARILDATAKKLGLPAEKVVKTVGEHANTSAASVPLALDVAVRDGRIQPGQLVMLEAMGGGFTWGACLLRL